MSSSGNTCVPHLAEMGILEFIRLAGQGKILRLAEQGIHDFIILA